MNQVCICQLQRSTAVLLGKGDRVKDTSSSWLLLSLSQTDNQHPAFWGQPMSAEQSFNIHNTFPLPIGASRAEPVSHTQYVQLGSPDLFRKES